MGGLAHGHCLLGKTDFFRTSFRNPHKKSLTPCLGVLLKAAANICARPTPTPLLMLPTLWFLLVFPWDAIV